jgi:hypothetical protein
VVEDPVRLPWDAGRLNLAGSDALDGARPDEAGYAERPAQMDADAEKSADPEPDVPAPDDLQLADSQ